MTLNKQNIPCEVIEDLLPSYTDDLLSPVTSAIVKEHLETCENCRLKYENMRAASFYAAEDDHAEIDYLKTVKKKGRKHILAGILCTIAAFLILFLLRSAIIGSAVNPDYLNYTVSGTPSAITVSGTSAEDTYIRKVSFTQKEDILYVSFTGVTPLFHHTTVFSETFETDTPIREVHIDDRIVYADGISISPVTSRVYNAKNAYVGDASADVNLACMLGVQGTFGTITNELHTDSEPYGWDLYIASPVKEEYRESAELMMKNYAVILLAETENLNQVSFIYTSGSQDYTVSLTLEQANASYGMNIKDAYDDIKVLEELMQKTGNSSSLVYETTESENTCLTVTNFTEESIASMSLSTGKASQSGMNADMSPLYKGESLTFELYPEEVENADTFCLTITCSDGTEYRIPLECRLNPHTSMNVRLTGNRTQGFRIIQ